LDSENGEKERADYPDVDISDEDILEVMKGGI
jgi:hypothetical protein